MNLTTRLKQLEASQRIIVVDFNDYAAEFRIIDAIPDEEIRKKRYDEMIGQIANESGETGLGEIVIWTGIDENGRWTVYSDVDRRIVRNYCTTADLSWQEAIQTVPITDVNEA